MSLNAIPAGGVREFPAPEATPYGEQRFSVRYKMSRTRGTYSVPVPKSPPDHLLLSVETEIENGAVFMRAVEVDVAVEGDAPEDTLMVLIDTIEGWLRFLRDEEPTLAPELEPQRRYVELLRYHPVTWFKPIRID